MHMCTHTSPVSGYHRNKQKFIHTKNCQLVGMMFGSGIYSFEPFPLVGIFRNFLIIFMEMEGTNTTNSKNIAM